jgi:hypothetical protein
MRDHPHEPPGGDPGLSDDDLHDLIEQVFGDGEIDWEATRQNTRTVEDLRLVRNLYNLWKIYEFNRLIIDGEDPRDSLGSQR